MDGLQGKSKPEEQVTAQPAAVIEGTQGESTAGNDGNAVAQAYKDHGAALQGA